MAISDGAKVTIETCLNVRKGESVLVLTDSSKERIAQTLYEAANNIGAETILVKIPDPEQDGQEPPVSIARLMKETDVIIITDRKSVV